jgi:hypothetical protein
VQFLLWVVVIYAGASAGLAFTFNYTQMVIWVSVLTPLLFCCCLVAAGALYDDVDWNKGPIKFFIALLVGAAFLGVGLQQYHADAIKYGTPVAITSISTNEILNHSSSPSFAINLPLRLLPNTFSSYRPNSFPPLNSNCGHGSKTKYSKLWMQAVVDSNYSPGMSINVWAVRYKEVKSTSDFPSDSSIFTNSVPQVMANSATISCQPTYAVWHDMLKSFVVGRNLTIPTNAIFVADDSLFNAVYVGSLTYAWVACGLLGFFCLLPITIVIYKQGCDNSSDSSDSSALTSNDTYQPLPSDVSIHSQSISDSIATTQVFFCAREIYAIMKM